MTYYSNVDSSPSPLDERPARLRPGPKPVGGRAKSGAERTRAYRERLLEDQDREAAQLMKGVALREKLHRALLELERFESGRAKKLPPEWQDLQADLHEGAQYAAQMVWQEVGRRYGFKLGKKKSPR